MATFYIDPSAAVNGNGSLASPFNTWAGLTLTANNTYLQKRGTVYVGAAVRPASQVSAAATPLTIGAYANPDGSDDARLPKPIVDHNGGTNGVSAVYVDTCTNAVVRDIVGRNSRGSLAGGIGVRRSVGVKVQRCEGYDSEHGLIIQQDQASGTSTCTDVTVEDCYLHDNIGGGVCLRWGAASTAVLKRITLQRNTCVRNGLGKGFGAGGSSIPAGGISSYAAYKTDTNINYRGMDIRVLNNFVADNNGYGINIDSFGNEAWQSTIARNEVTRNGASGDVDTHSLWVGNSFGVLVERNKVYGNSARVGATSGSGVGIFIDYNGVSATGGANNIVRRNLIYDQFRGATTAPIIAASSGIIVLANSGTIVEGNVILGCRNGISVGNGVATDGTAVRNNTVIGCEVSGINVLPLGTNTSVKNNVVTGSATGLFVNTTSTTGYAERNNCVYGCAVAKANGTATAQTPTALDATDITADPLLGAYYRPTAASPLIAAGAPLDVFPMLDAAGVQFNRVPTIGAFEYVRPRAGRRV